jgi:hypothetical protein
LAYRISGAGGEGFVGGFDGGGLVGFFENQEPIATDILILLLPVLLLNI